MKRFFTSVAVFACLLQCGSWFDVHAQTLVEPIDAPSAEIQPFTDSELDLLLGPIALYPDPLLAVLLPAATRPTEIVLAARYLDSGGAINDIESQSWSESVQALAHYPEVLRWMDQNLDWTRQLGEAFLQQPESVMDAIQRLRALAQSLGNLQTTAEDVVETADGAIDILPANPDDLFVPVYDPNVIYSSPPTFAAGPYTRFKSSLPVGVWLNRDWDWPNKRIVLWTQQTARPQTWWSHSRAERAKSIRDLKEWHPPQHGGKYPSKFWAARAHQSHHLGPDRPATQVHATAPSQISGSSRPQSSRH